MDLAWDCSLGLRHVLQGPRVCTIAEWPDCRLEHWEGYDAWERFWSCPWATLGVEVRAGLRIQHGLNELVGATYGQVVAFYSKRALGNPKVEELAENSPHEKGGQTMELRQEQADLMKSVVETVSQDIVKEFEEQFSSWVQTWDAPHTAHLSNPSFVRFSKEFSALVAMGTEILPLVVNKLTKEENFFALQLYDALQPDVRSIVSIDPEDAAILEGEQGRAARTVEQWITNL